jgi:DNA-binding response OmpR family regulator
MDGQEGEWLAFENPYDVVILDLMLPVQDGLTVLRKMRKGGIHTPVLILTAKDTTDDVVKGLDEGADDYLTKPFSLDELLARVRTLLRRKGTDTATTIKVGPLEINPAKKQVTRDNKVIDLTAKEYALLEYFARNAGTVLSRTQLSEHVWDMNFEPNSNVVDVYVGYLRNKIDKAWGSHLIKTMRGHGYILDPGDQSSAPAAGQPGEKSPNDVYAP